MVEKHVLGPYTVKKISMSGGWSYAIGAGDGGCLTVAIIINHGLDPFMGHGSPEAVANLFASAPETAAERDRLREALAHPQQRKLNWPN
jgi:hypothetical protein